MFVEKLSEYVASARILLGSGVVEVWRPDRMVRSLISFRRYGPFAGVVHHGAARYGASVALRDERGALTFRELDELSNALARGLAELGIGSGDVIAALGRDHRGLVLTVVAANKVGARLVLMNTGFAKPQLTDVAAREGVSAVLVDSEFAELVDDIPADIPRILTWTDDAATAKANGDKTITDLMAGRSTAPVAAPRKPGGMVLLTSGTTGTPKGAPRDRVDPLQSAQLLDRIPWPASETYCVAAPLFHATGLAIFMLGLSLGNQMLLQRRFDPERTLQLIAQHRASTVVLVPTMLHRILELGPDVLAKYDLSSVKIIFAAGSSLSPDLCRRTAAVFGDVLYNLYGSTEVSIAAVATPQDLWAAPGTVGRPPVGCRVALYDEQRQRITQPGVTGTIFVSSGLSFTGYTGGGHKETVDGLLSTGDLGHFDVNGLWFVDGRDDDMIVSGGENVFPLEVENLLVEHPGVVDVAVIGVDDADFGKRLRAFVVAEPAAELEADEIRAYVRANLARHKVPRDVIFVPTLPRNATGKLLKVQLQRD